MGRQGRDARQAGTLGTSGVWQLMSGALRFCMQRATFLAGDGMACGCILQGMLGQVHGRWWAGQAGGWAKRAPTCPGGTKFQPLSTLAARSGWSTRTPLSTWHTCGPDEQDGRLGSHPTSGGQLTVAAAFPTAWQVTPKVPVGAVVFPNQHHILGWRRAAAPLHTGCPAHLDGGAALRCVPRLLARDLGVVPLHRVVGVVRLPLHPDLVVRLHHGHGCRQGRAGQGSGTAASSLQPWCSVSRGARGMPGSRAQLHGNAVQGLGLGALCRACTAGNPHLGWPAAAAPCWPHPGRR